jgi:adenine/guanine phosphoribosyltransferase-like PRPP-binding protein
MSTERIIVDRAVSDSLAQKLAQRASALPIGDHVVAVDDVAARGANQQSQRTT